LTKRPVTMSVDAATLLRVYTENAEREDRVEKELSLHTEGPREYLNRYPTPADRVLDAGDGPGTNAIVMSHIRRAVILLDIT